ncbi:hypothetical protein KDX27_14860 [Burkholderia cenocepacia]|uniref:terminase large subunit domain-containing protein n=1 Tax=Burkholderia cenocepacia TaxID=95486 RepID=UPI001B9B1671|nr:terminase family protein [Burkholderia cenocepacia]MBR8168998.1 hypothetical protein [Burkholderia cenocepacia]MBR8425022.1 hypothetical protein [Burkholderia cenocepacia]
MPRIEISLPTLHSGQMAAWNKRKRFNALRCGRRWGKTQMAIAIAGTQATHGEYIGIFAPDYKIMSETYRELEEALAPVTAHSNKTDGLIRLISGGRIDFWTLNNPKAGRSRKYHGVLVDEAAFAGDDMSDIWAKAIAPTLFDFRGWAWAMSTPNGSDPDNWFYQVCTNPALGWTEYHAPSNTNPHLPQDEFERIRASNMPLVFQQEYLADFVDWNGAAFFSEESLLVDGEPVDYPTRCDQVFAVVDTALKDGLEHDGTAVTYFARNVITGTPLTILDWDVLQIEGALLESWLPTVAQRCEELAAQTGARQGSLGGWIEDKASGIVLLQQAKRRGLPFHPIEEKLVDLGKEGRALSVSGYVHRGEVKISRYAHDKVTNYKGQTRNHLISQVCGFRLGTKTPHHMDLLDTFTYGVAISLGDSEGY